MSYEKDWKQTSDEEVFKEWKLFTPLCTFLIYWNKYHTDEVKYTWSIDFTEKTSLFLDTSLLIGSAKTLEEAQVAIITMMKTEIRNLKEAMEFFG